MTYQDYLNYKKEQKRQYKLELEKNNDKYGTITGFTNSEFNKSMKDVKQKSSTTRRTHARGNYWNHYNV